MFSLIIFTKSSNGSNDAKPKSIIFDVLFFVLITIFLGLISNNEFFFIVEILFLPSYVL